jgi:predicted SAM-dependent methyltransferase
VLGADEVERIAGSFPGSVAARLVGESSSRPAYAGPVRRENGAMTATTSHMNYLRTVATLRRQLQATIDRTLTSAHTTHGVRRTLRAAIRELDLWEAHARSTATLGTQAGRLEARHIQIGGGVHTLNGYVNVDLVPPADVLWDVREGLPFREITAQVIFTEHFLEHIDYPVSVKRFVAECFRVLADDGQLIVGVPDAAMVIDAYVHDDPVIRERMMREWYDKRDNQEHFNTYLDLVNYVFRDQDDNNRYTPHLWSYDYDKLASLMVATGFRSVEPWQFDPRLANPNRQWGSVYAIAVK